MKSLIFPIVFFAFSFIFFQSVYACSCLPAATAAIALETSDTVFSGKVLQIKKQKPLQTKDSDAVRINNSFTSIEAVFEVQKVWKGVSEKHVSVFTASSSAACGYNFEKDQMYLVYGNSGGGEKIYTSICSRTSKLENAEEDLEEIGAGKDIKEIISETPPSEKDETGFIPVEGDSRIFYQKIGEGEQVVVVPFHLFRFNSFKHLAKNRTMIFYDPRNRGRSDRFEKTENITIQSDVEDLEKLRRHFGLKKMTLIGQSYLATMVVLYALKYPQYVEKIIQIAPPPLEIDKKFPKELTAQDETPVPDPKEAEKIAELRKQGYHKTNPKDFCEKDWAVTRTILVGDPKNAERLESPCDFPNEWAENLARHWGNLYPSLQKLNVPKSEIARVKVPVLTIHGTQDRQAAYGAGKEWVEMLPNARLLTVKGAAHVPQADEPTYVFSAIENFLADKPIMEVAPQEVTFKSKDGLKLFADIYESPKGKNAPFIMLFHQGGGDVRGEYSTIVPKLLESGYNVFATDTRQGGDRFGTNRTMSGVKKEFTYCDAYQDLESALEYAKEQGFTGKKIVWGSSFSATLVLKLGENYPEDLAGVLAFSPASGPPMGECQPVEYAENLKLPTLILRPRTEMQSERSQNQFAEFKRQGHQTYIAENGVHGSSMLVESRIKGSAEEHWNIVLKFIKKTLE